MPDCPTGALISRRYRESFGAWMAPGFPEYFTAGQGAALGYRRADCGPLFLETYLDKPVEQHVADIIGRRVERSEIVEIGNFASDNAMAMIKLWSAAANDLADSSEIAVATLTASLRKMFARIGVPIHAIAPADPQGRIANLAEWGSYYDCDPVVCCGNIVEGQEAISRFLARRAWRVVA